MTEPALLDTDILSEVIKSRDPAAMRFSQDYLRYQGRFQFSIVTRYEILRGLLAKDAFSQVASFNVRCLRSSVLPLTDKVMDRAAEIYALLKKRGALIGDADILIAATAQINDLPLVTGNLSHFGRIPGLRLESWREA